jgi:rhodanese-related sulfurtransferase
LAGRNDRILDQGSNLFLFGNFMAADLKMNEPEKARAFFEEKLAFTTGPVELARAVKQRANIVVVDVREAQDYRKGHVPGAVNLPRDQWRTRAGLRKDALNVLYCYSHVCHLAATAAADFAADGYSVMEMDGGFEAWKENDLEIESELSSGKRAGKEREALVV